MLHFQIFSFPISENGYNKAIFRFWNISSFDASTGSTKLVIKKEKKGLCRLFIDYVF